MADRITNLQMPPKFWSKEKTSEYYKEAVIILEILKGSNEFLEKRLENKILEYFNLYIR